ncbi:MAG: tRNA pseudouridine(55) synthase TruB [Gammaproteobacteria bacterium]|nr:tRNA pseudouridine(55) synthase TruB [Gammaproteobacteria bacterium]
MKGNSSKRKGRRSVNGILLLDKPPGITSNEALQRAKHAYNARKAGHTGSLDPIATGLLPLCFGEATKASSFFLDADKRYRTLLKLGESTDTGDAEGRILAQRPVDVSGEDIAQVVQGFYGAIDQIPPMYSAVKRDGQPLYKLARQGIEVERKPRRVRVHDLQWARRNTHHLKLDIHCSSGFYVRGLAHEIGELLGCGAHVAELRRVGVGRFDVEDAIALDRICATADLVELGNYLIPVDEGLRHLPDVRLSTDAAYYLCRGQPVRAADLPKHGWVRLYADGAGFLGIGKILSDGRVAPKRLFHTT